MILPSHFMAICHFFKQYITFLVNKLSKTKKKQGKSEGFDSCDRPSNFTQVGFKSSIFQPVWPWNLIDDLKNNNRAPLLCYIKLSASNWSYSQGMLKLGQNRQYFLPCDVEIRWMTLKNNRAPPLCYVKLCASFQSDRWIKTRVIIRKRSIWVKISDLLSRVTLKFNGGPWKQ